MYTDKKGREIETKILVTGDPITFSLHVRNCGGDLVRGPVVLHDFSFRPILGTVGSVPHLTMSNHGAISYPHFAEVITYLGFAVPEGEAQYVQAPLELPDHNVRLRLDRDHLLFTAKAQPDIRNGIVHRHEVEAVLSKSCFAEVLTTLVMAGYHPKYQRQKQRIYFRVGCGYVELNQSPLPNVPPWIEIEAHEEGEVVAIAEQLGFSPADFLGLSDTELFMQFGYEKGELKRVLF